MEYWRLIRLKLCVNLKQREKETALEDSSMVRTCINYLANHPPFGVPHVQLVEYIGPDSGRGSGSQSEDGDP